MPCHAHQHQDDERITWHTWRLPPWTGQRAHGARPTEIDRVASPPTCLPPTVQTGAGRRNRISTGQRTNSEGTGGVRPPARGVGVRGHPHRSPALEIGTILGGFDPAGGRPPQGHGCPLPQQRHGFLPNRNDCAIVASVANRAVSLWRPSLFFPLVAFGPQAIPGKGGKA